MTMVAERNGPRTRVLLELAASVPRLNPQQSFKQYTGPFNLLGVDYYASTGFTGLFGVVLSFVCLAVPTCWLLFLLFRTCFRACCHCCLARTPQRAPSRKRMLFSHCSAAFFGAGCIAGAACVWGSGPRLRAVLRDIVAMGVEQTQLMLAQAMAVIAVLNKVTPALQSAGASTADVADAAKTLEDAADAVSAALDDNEATIEDGLDRLAVAASVLGALLIMLVLLAWLGHALAPRRAARHFIGFVNFFYWLFLVVGWVICGITYILYLLISDACLALPAALADPVASGLAERLPCLDPAFAADKSSAARQPVYDAIDGTNAALRACTAQGPIGVAYLCNPVLLSSGVYSDRAAACAAPYTVVPPPTAATFTAVYTQSACPNQAVRSQFSTMSAGVAAAVQLQGVMPDVDDLVSCAFITDTLAGIEEECPTLRAAVRQLFGGLLLCCLAFSIMLCVGVWAYRHAYPPKEPPPEPGVFKVDEEAPEEGTGAPPESPVSASMLVNADVNAKA